MQAVVSLSVDLLAVIPEFLKDAKVKVEAGAICCRKSRYAMRIGMLGS